jgi:alpha,alpha-trehalase
MRSEDNSGPSGADAVVADLAGVTGRSGDRPVSALPDGLQSYVQIAAAVAARRPVMLLDFDGTLCDIVDNPNSASLSAGAVDALKALAAQCDVAVLSGRDVADLVSRVGLPGIWYGGSHGFQTRCIDAVLSPLLRRIA